MESADTPRTYPSEILDLVLPFLPLKEALQTSILSKDCRYKWTMLENLVFDDLFFQYFQAHDAMLEIFKILEGHQGPLVSFRLDRPIFNKGGPPFPTSLEFDTCMHVVCLKDVQKLSLCMYTGPSDSTYRLNSSFFKCQNLTWLNLSGCSLNPPRGFKGFGNLTELYLGGGVSVDSLVFRELISHSPLLERLFLHHCNHFEHLEITSTSLKWLEFTGTASSIRVNTPMVKSLSVCAEEVDELKYFTRPTFDFRVFFQYVPALETLVVRSSTLKYLFNRDVLEVEGPPMYLQSVRNLDISVSSNAMEVSSAAYLITSCPKLQSLYVTCPSSIAIVEAHVQFLRAKQKRSAMGRLQTVKLICLVDDKGAEMKLEFIRFILACAPVLEKITLGISASDFDRFSQMMEEKLKEFPRASANVKFFFYDSR